MRKPNGNELLCGLLCGLLCDCCVIVVWIVVWESSCYARVGPNALLASRACSFVCIPCALTMAMKRPAAAHPSSSRRCARGIASIVAPALGGATAAPDAKVTPVARADPASLIPEAAGAPQQAAPPEESLADFLEALGAENPDANQYVYLVTVARVLPNLVTAGALRDITVL